MSKRMIIVAGLAGALAGFGSTTAIAGSGVNDAINRTQSRIVGSAIQRQIQQSLFRARRTVQVRAAPSSTAPVLGRVEAGKPVTVSGLAGGDQWAEVDFGGQRGYVFAPLLERRDR